MKIRILENTIRLRLTQGEVEELQNEGQVTQQTEFSNGSDILKYSISSSEEVSELVGIFKNGHIKVLLPESDAFDWINSNKAGIENQEYTDQGDGLKILIEKDFQCLHKRKNEDESDAFPNPLSRKK